MTALRPLVSVASWVCTAAGLVVVAWAWALYPDPWWDVAEGVAIVVCAQAMRWAVA